MLRIMTTARRLIEAAKKNDAETQYKILLEECKDRMIRTAITNSQNIDLDDAEDLVQDLMIHLVTDHCLENLDPEKNIYSFLVRCVHNRLRDHLTRAGTIHRPHICVPTSRIDASRPDPIDTAESSDTIDASDRFEDQIPDVEDSPGTASSLPGLDSLVQNPIHRAVIRISMGYQPLAEEYQVLAEKTRSDRFTLSRNIETLFQDLGIKQNTHSRRIAKLHHLYIDRSSRRRTAEHELETLIASGSTCEMEERFEREITRLTRLERQAYRLYTEESNRDLKRVPSKDIAAATSMSPANVDQILARYRRKLSEMSKA